MLFKYNHNIANINRIKSTIGTVEKVKDDIRYTVFKEGIQKAKDNLIIGEGFYKYKRIPLPIENIHVTDHYHNNFIETAVTQGFLTLVVYIAFLATLFIRMLKNYFKENDRLKKYIKLYLSISTVLVTLSIIVFFTKGLNYGIDFSGGNLFQLKYTETTVTLNQINENLDKLAEELPQVNSNSRKVQISNDGTVIVRVPELNEADKDKVLESLKNLGAYNLDKEDKVGASIGDDLKKSAIYSLGIGAILIVIYITMRFEFSFAVGGILSLIHDIIIAVGFIALMGYEVDTPFIAAILTILGYSINDTIVIYDRIRENLKRKHKGWTLEECMDESVNQTAIRSINTSVTTLFSVIAILIFGGASLKTFIMTLLIGILAGTYSSIFVATPIVYLLNKRKGNNMQDMFKDDDENNDGKRVEKILV